MTRGSSVLGFALALGVVLAAVAAAAAPDFPRLTGRVVDNANILGSATESELTRQLAAHEEETSNQVVVVTLPSLQGHTIEDFGYQLGRHWALGQKDRNNGVLLIVAPQERKLRIEVGYGLEGDLTDALAKTIIETEITPAFRNGQMEAGVSRGISAILAALDGTYEPKPARSGGISGTIDQVKLVLWGLQMIFLGVGLFLLMRYRSETFARKMAQRR